MRLTLNKEYFSLWKELLLPVVLKVIPRRKGEHGAILIVIPCLIGEFAAAVPATFDFIQRHPGQRVDLIVSPAVKELAERMAGIGRVFSAIPTAHRRSSANDDKPAGPYERIIILRSSPEAYKMVRRVRGRIQTMPGVLGKYILNVGKNMFLRKYPKPWRQINFELLGGQEKYHDFSQMFNIKPEDQVSLDQFPFLKSVKPKIIIHTYAHWPMKRWSNDKWIELLEKIHDSGDYEFIFVGEKRDQDNFEYISSRLSFPVQSLIERTTILELVLLLRQADYFIGIDSGPRNLAHLTDTRSITILGPGPHFYMPDNPRDIVLDKSRGRGLSHLLFTTNKSYTEKISAQEAYDAFLSLIKN